MLRTLRQFHRDTTGSTLIETAFVAPALIAMTLGGVEVSSMVARQTEMQSIAANGMEIILAAAPEDDADVARTISELKTYLASASDLTIVETGNQIEPGQISVYKRWRCGNNSDRQATEGCANASQTQSEFLVIYMKDTYSPIWTNYGIGDDMTFEVKRSIQIG
ncbi:TadE/TadG family type IV pilus assembly protein [Croceicoccus sediminis]|uniref:TadE/TadG family type IV pilus assembly protein n=1 Tax=Croceicoccus sediminis TaxID=2571150 RepID=UPI0011822121|nr:TadE/TadG family type IV pilus assembly protein [Croceicoccus sediminis]